jgi:hypothetical protein
VEVERLAECAIHGLFNAFTLADKPMPIVRTLAATVLAVGLLAAVPGDAQRRRDQDQAFAATRAGHVLPLQAIEARVLPQMRGADYLGPEFDAGSGTYRLKFMRGGAVIWVDVDGRSGAIVGRSGY